jgi:hypothetical protein
MTRSRPFLFAVVMMLMVMAALVTLWLALLPRKVLQNFTSRIAQEQGLVVETKSPRLHFGRGLSVDFDAVSLTDEKDGSTLMTARQVTVHTNWSSLFGASSATDTVTIVSPVITLDVAAGSSLPFLLAPKVIIRDGAVRLHDSKRKSVAAFSDVSATLTTDLEGALKAEAQFLQGTALNTLVFEAENAQRLFDSGSPADASLSAKDQVFAFSGRAKFRDGFGMDGQLSVEAADAASALAMLDLPLSMLEGVGKLSMQSSLASHGLSIDLKTLNGSLGASHITGDAKIAAGPDQTKLVAVLTVDKVSVPLDISALPLTQPWSEKPIPFGDLTSIDADASIKIGALTMRNIALGSADVSAKGDSGTWNISVTGDAIAGGAVNLQTTLASSGGRLKMDSTTSLKGVGSKVLLDALLGLKAFAGPLDVEGKTQSEGQSVAELISNLQGRFSLSSDRLSLEGVDLGLLFSQSGEGWRNLDSISTMNMGLKGEAELKDGIVTLTSATLDHAAASAKPKGEIDLLRQAFNVQLQPKGKGVDPKMSLQGTWTAPKFVGSPVPLRPTADTGKPVVPAAN